MTRDEFERQKRIAREEGEKEIRRKINDLWMKHLDFKIENCKIKEGDFVIYSKKTWRVLSVEIGACNGWGGGFDVNAKIERVKKDKTPTSKPEIVIVSLDNLELIK